MAHAAAPAEHDAQALLTLYELAAHRELAHFELTAARLLGRMVGFDGAVWGSGHTSEHAALQITHATLVDRPASLLSEYPDLAQADPVTRRFIAQPTRLQCVAVATTYAGTALRPLADYLARHRIAHLLLQGHYHWAPTHLGWLTAYRAEAACPFSLTARQRYQRLLPHWVQARALCARLQLGSPEAAGDGLALCDRGGTLQVADADFAALTGLSPGTRLGQLLGHSVQGHRQTLDGLQLDARPAGEHWVIVRVSSRHAATALPPRLAEVARRYADGASHKQIARQLERSRATIRTQLRDIFQRLEVHNRVELLHRLSGQAARQALP